MPSESNISKWMKVLVPTLAGICLSLASTLWYQSSTVTRLETTIKQRASLIVEFKAKDAQLEGDIVEMRDDINELRTEIKLVDSTQLKMLNVVDRLSTTLTRLEVAMGKLETKLEYSGD